MDARSGVLDGREDVKVRLLAGLAIAVGFTLAAAVVLVQDRLLEEEFYAAALERSDAYERAYSEVLADPELVALTERLIGQLRVKPQLAAQARVLSTSALRWALPPARIRAGVEALISQALAYVRGDTDRLDSRIGVADVLDRVDAAAKVKARTLLAAAAEQVAATAVDQRAAIDRFADELASGTVPDVVPVLGGDTFDPESALNLILDSLGDALDARARGQVAAALLTGDQRDVLIAASSVVIEAYARRVSEQLRDGTVVGGLDVVAEIADRSGSAQERIIDRLNTVRDLARWFGVPTVLVAVGLIGGGAVTLVARRGRRPWLAVRDLAVSAVAAGATVGFAWLLARHAIDSPLRPATTTGEGSWRLPAGMRSVIGDVEAALAAELARVVRWLALGPMVAGSVVAVAAAVVLRMDRAKARVAGVATGVIATGTVAVLSGSAAQLPESPTACNGHEVLCERRYDEVVHAATHNSMSSPDVVHVWPEHDHDIRTQLDSGIRTLLIDTHYPTPLVSAEQLVAAEPLLPPALAAQLFTLLKPLYQVPDGMYLCHAHCSFGGTPLVDTLRDIGAFLDDNPTDVVTLIIQDGLTAADTASAFALAGLDRSLHTHPRGGQWPTLGWLIEHDERLVVFAEEHDTSPPWYHQAFEHIQETPYLFRDVSEFSCRPNRGRSDAPLFLMNHWVQRVAPDRADATIANAHHLIVSRARACEQERGQLPNFIAVNFSNIGDVLGAVATLNETGTA